MCFAVIACLAAPVVLLQAFPTGPGPGRTGGPGEGGSCSGGSCHFGAAIRGEGIALYFPNGPFYQAGKTQRIQVQITGEPTEPDTARYGFQISARISGTQAPGGRFRPVDASAWVQCENGVTPSVDGCPAGQAIEYVQHREPARFPIWEIDWTPPAGAEGEIEFYAAANAANGLGDQAGDRIYQRSFRVRPGGAIQIRNLLEGAVISPGTWILAQMPETSLRSPVRIEGVDVAAPLFPAPGVLVAQVPTSISEGHGTLRAGALEAPLAITKSAPVIAVQDLPVFQARQTVSMLVHGCGAAPERPSVWIANRMVAATVAAVPNWPGSCRLGFEVPAVHAGEHLLRACMDGQCSPAKLIVEVLP